MVSAFLGIYFCSICANTAAEIRWAINLMPDFCRMSLFMASLNSGSNGNAYYVGTNEEAVIIDAGLSCREMEKRMKRLGLPVTRVKALFISHEHTDHICGLDTFARKNHLPVYASAPTLGKLQNNGYQAKSFISNVPVKVGGLTIRPFFKEHDAVDAHSFTISGNGVTVGVFTDIGRICDQLIYHFSRCNGAFLEANYDDDMLDKGKYPQFLKQRIRGGRGHLSNAQALELMIAHKPSYMDVILLSHLSKDNNDPELAVNLFRAKAGDTFIEVASRYQESEVYEVVNVPQKRVVSNLFTSSRQEQLSLF